MDATFRNFKIKSKDKRRLVGNYIYTNHAFQETVIYTDGKTMEVDDGNTKQKIADIQSHIKDEGSISRSMTPTPIPTSSSSNNNSCYSSLPTMVGLQSAVAPESAKQVGFFFLLVI